MSDWKNVQYKDGKLRTSNGGGGGASALTDLSDVNVSSPSNGQVLKYNNSTSKWENANESGGGGTVTDVQVDGTSVVNQQGVAEITSPNIPVTDVKVNGTSVVSSKEALIKSYKEVTLAEYQALPSSKTSDGVMYCIKDIGGANQFPPLIYSDEEREVGVWRDGKPLYQKTIHYNQSIPANTNNVEIICGLSNVDVVADIRAIAKDGTEYKPLPQNIYTSQGQYPEYSANMQGYDKSTDKVRIDTGAYRSYDGCDITLWYTKTTDTAGSGTWTTDGTYAHHYSTSEKVIGTWIDGSPLYEKVFTGMSESITQSAWNVLSSISITNLAEVIDIEVYRIGGNGKITYVNLEAFSANGSNVQVEPSQTQTITMAIVRYTKTT